jgi:hypothetical protein
MRQCTHKYMYISDFFIGFLQRDVRDMKYVDGVFPKLSHLLMSVSHHNIIRPFIFSLDFLWNIYDNWTSTV